ncbi:hypothetical protein BGX24_001855 [Mortierella sp. AD032]|nr:hypothetical protein BGX24_001855 [Mortierella sp. AD032]
MQLLIILWSNDTYHYDAKIDDTRLISSVEHANKNQSTGIESIFDMEKIHGICSSYGLHFPDRMGYINSYSVRILGEVVPVHQGRGGCPIVSDLDEAKKDKTRKRTGSCTGISLEFAQKRLLLKARRQQHALEKMARAPRTAQQNWGTKISSRLEGQRRYCFWTGSRTTLAWETCVLPGIRQYSVTAAIALSAIALSFSSVTIELENELLQVVDDVVVQKPHEEQEQKMAVLPHIYTVTAQLLNDLTFSNKNQKKREKKLATDTPNAIATEQDTRNCRAARSTQPSQ